MLNTHQHRIKSRAPWCTHARASVSVGPLSSLLPAAGCYERAVVRSHACFRPDPLHRLRRSRGDRRAGSLDNGFPPQACSPATGARCGVVYAAPGVSVVANNAGGRHHAALYVHGIRYYRMQSSSPRRSTGKKRRRQADRTRVHRVGGGGWACLGRGWMVRVSEGTQRSFDTWGGSVLSMTLQAGISGVAGSVNWGI